MITRTSGILVLLLPVLACAAGATPKPGKHIRECRNCPELVVLSAGSFQMGSPADEPERDADEPQHRVDIKRAFAIATTPVTWSQWEACVRDNWCEGAEIDLALRNNADGTRNANYKDHGRGTRPAVGMSWYDAQRFVGWLNWKTGNDDAYRLPSEAEWEYAARAGTATPFPWGKEIDYNRGNFGMRGHGERGPYTEGRDVFANEGAPYAATTRGHDYLGFRVAKTLD